MDITFFPPRVEKNCVYYSWKPSIGFNASRFWVEYPDLNEIKASSGKLAEAYFPVCLALSSAGKVRFRLPARIDGQVLKNWTAVIDTASDKLFRKKPFVEFVMEGAAPDYHPGPYPETALFFGGGTESLLTLARLKREGIRPHLVSFGGPKWAGSDPERNPDKFELDRKISSDLRLSLLRVRTNFKEVTNSPLWTDYMKPGVSAVNSCLFLPFFISFLMPVCEQLRIGRLVNGNEKMNFPDEYFCFSPYMTNRMTHIAKHVRYDSYLNNLLKEQVCGELYRRHSDIASYQYSCWRNERQRWCLGCEACLESYMLLKHNGLEPSRLGLRDAEILKNRRRLILEVIRSAEGRPGEIWERICRYPDLRRDPSLRSALNRILWGSMFYWRVYKKIPGLLRRILGLSVVAKAVKACAGLDR